MMAAKMKTDPWELMWNEHGEDWFEHTSRMEVEGGWIYRVLHSRTDEESGITHESMSTVFVPTPKGGR